MRMIRSMVSAAMILGVFAGPGRADVIFTLGNNPQPSQENVLLTGPGSGTNTFTGTTNQSGVGVSLSSTTNFLATQGFGQAQLIASGANTLLNDVTISLPGTTALPFGTFTGLIINPMQPTADTNATITVNAYDKNGITELPSTFTLPLSKNGQNFVTITTANGQTLSSVTIDSTAGFGVLSQVRISGAQLTSTVPGANPAVVPEPASLSLCAIGCAIAGGWSVRRRKGASV